MSELYNTWKGRDKGVVKSATPLLGMVYEGTNKFFGNVEVGVLVELHLDNDEAVLRTKDQKVVSVDKKSLKFVVSH